MIKKGIKHVELKQDLSCMLKGLSMYVVKKREFRRKRNLSFRLNARFFFLTASEVKYQVKYQFKQTKE